MIPTNQNGIPTDSPMNRIVVVIAPPIATQNGFVCPNQIRSTISPNKVAVSVNPKLIFTTHHRFSKILPSCLVAFRNPLRV